MALKLREYQKDAVRFLANKRKAYLTLEQGLGKTAVAITIAQKFIPVIVVCPSIAKINWQREVEKWRLLDVTAGVVKNGTSPLPSTDFVICSYEIATKRVSELMGLNPQAIIVDEAHYCKNPNAKRTKAIMAMIKAIPRAYCLTGTPMPNRPIELWPIMFALGLTDRNYYSFAYGLCGAYKAPFGDSNTLAYPKKLKPDKLKELAGLLRPGMFRRTKEQVLPELPPKTYQIVSLDLPVDERERDYDLKELECHMTSIGFEGLSELLRMQGISKIPMVSEYVKETFESGNAKKILLFARHRDVVKSLADSLRSYNPKIIMGGMSDKARQESIDSFQTDPKVRLIICNIDAAKTAITLTAANVVMFAESSWVPADIEQAVDRAHRIGQTENILVQFLVVSGSIDEYMLINALTKLEHIKEVVGS